jgi:hypothetical protein
MSALLPQFNKARKLVALCGVCTWKPLNRPYSVNSTSRMSVLVRTQLMSGAVQWFDNLTGLGREEC